MANVLTMQGGRKRIMVSTFVVRMQRLHFCLCVAGRRVPLDDLTKKNNNTRFSLCRIYDTIQLKHLYIFNKSDTFRIKKCTIKRGLL